MRILLVEDDALLGDGVCVGLTQAGFTVDWVKDGKAPGFYYQRLGYDSQYFIH